MNNCYSRQISLSSLWTMISREPTSRSEIVVDLAGHSGSVQLDLSKIGDEEIRKLLYLICQKQDLTSQSLRNDQHEDDTTCSGSFPTSPTIAATGSKVNNQNKNNSHSVRGLDQEPLTGPKEDGLDRSESLVSDTRLPRTLQRFSLQTLSAVRLVLSLVKFAILFALDIFFEVVRALSDLLVLKLFANLAKILASNLVAPCLDGLVDLLVQPSLSLLKRLLSLCSEALDPLLGILSKLSEIVSVPVRSFRLVNYSSLQSNPVWEAAPRFS